MSDPRRLMDERERASAWERELVRAGSEAGPSPEQRQRVWAAIAAQSLPPALGHGATGAGTTGLVLTKAMAVVVLLGGGTFVSYRAMMVPPTRAPVRPALQTPTAATAPLAPVLEPTGVVAPTQKSGRPPPRPQVGVAPGRRAVKVAVPVWEPAASPLQDADSTRVTTARASRLREESAMILEARSALRADHPSRALALVQRVRAEFPDGLLVQEREALTIEALARSGQPALASQRAQSFLRDYPNSPHAADVSSFAVRP